MSSRRTSFLGCGCAQCVNMTICISATDLAHSRPLNPLREERISPLAAATQSPKADLNLFLRGAATFRGDTGAGGICAIVVISDHPEYAGMMAGFKKRPN